jgi:hypothetical protein
MAQYATPTITGESSVAIESGIKCYLPELTIDGNTCQQPSIGNNLFYQNGSIGQSAGVTCTYNAETQEFTLNGTKTSNGNVIISRNMKLPRLRADRKYRITRYVTGGSMEWGEALSGAYVQMIYSFFKQGSDSSFGRIYEYPKYNNPEVFSGVVTMPADTTEYTVYVQIGGAHVFNNWTFKLMLEEYEGQAAGEYKPYNPLSPDYPQEILNVGSTKAILPSDYQQVEYIESTGEQYIELDIEPNAELKLDTTIQFTVNYAGVAGSYLNGIVTGGGRFGFGCASSFSENFVLPLGNKNLDSFVKVDTNKHRIIIQGNGYRRVDNTEATNNVTFTGEYKKIPIFAAMGKNGLSFFCSMRLYDYKLYDGDTLVRNLIPCYQKGEKKPGLYDLVTGTFYVNQGEGEDFKIEDSVDIIEIKVRGKNIVNPVPVSLSGGAATITQSNNSDGTILINGTHAGAETTVFIHKTLNQLSLKSGKKYTVAVKALEGEVIAGGVAIYIYKGTSYFNNSGWIDNTNTVFSKNTITITEESEYTAKIAIKTSTKNEDGNVVDLRNLKLQLMLYEGEYTTDAFPEFEPYIEPQTITIPSRVVKENGDVVDLRFAKYDDTRKDSLIVDGVNKKVVYKQMLNKVIVPADKWKNKYYYANSMGLVAYSALSDNCYRNRGFCSHAATKYVAGASTYHPGGIWVGVGGNETSSKAIYWIGIISLLGYDSEWADKTNPTSEEWEIALGKFQAWLKEQEANGYPFECVYIMSAPIDYDITDTPLGEQLLGLIQNKGTTIIEASNTNNLSQTLTTKYLKHV